MEKEYLTYYQSPIGSIEIRANDSFVTALSFKEPLEVKGDDTENEVLYFCKEELDKYFSGRLIHFKTPIFLSGTAFQKNVWENLKRIAYGSTLTYASLSEKLGDRKAIRAVAGANGKNKIALIIPCHRVIGSDGSLTGYAFGLERKAWLLKHEGAILM